MTDRHKAKRSKFESEFSRVRDELLVEGVSQVADTVFLSFEAGYPVSEEPEPDYKSVKYIRSDKAKEIIVKELQDKIIKNIDLVSAKEAFKDYEENGGKELAQVKQDLGTDE